MEPTWHYRQGIEEGGPVSTDELLRLVLNGRLKASSFVRNGQDSQWRPAGIYEELREVFTKSLPPPLPPAPPLPAQVKPIWPWVAGAVGVLGLPAAIMLLIALLGNTERSPAEESIPSEVVVGGSPTAGERSAAPPLTISGEDATEDLIQMMAEMTEEQQTAIGLQYLATGQDFYGARIRITNRGDVPIRVRPENVRLHLQGDTVGVSSSRDSRFLRTTLLEPGRYVEGLVVYRARRETEDMSENSRELANKLMQFNQKLGLSPGPTNEVLAVVVGYGARTNVYTTKPTIRPAEISIAMKSINLDHSEHEMQCDAIQFALANYRKAAAADDRQLVLILATNESGDMGTNVSKLEPTLKMAKEAEAKIFVIGSEAVFGFPYAYRRRISANDPDVPWVRVMRGPETPTPEQIQIDGLGRRDITRHLTIHPSGFGPYEQMRLARETGGRFVMLPSKDVELPSRTKEKLDLTPLRSYLPELSSSEEYKARRDADPMRRAIFQVISDLNPYQAGEKGTRATVRTSGFSIEPKTFAEAATIEIKKAQDLIRFLQEAQKSIDAVRPQRAQEKSRRWQANYDLLYAETISFQARLVEYEAALVDFVKSPKKITNPLGPAQPTNEWGVRTTTRLLNPDATKALRARAEMLLREVAEKNPGTPWAQRALDELKRGYGVEFQENYVPPRAIQWICLPLFEK